MSDSVKTQPTRDLITQGGNGWVAQRMLEKGFNAAALRTNTLLNKDEWIQFDQVVIDVARQRLNGVADVINAGLTFGLEDALGVTQVEWEVMSDMTAAQQSMDGITRGERDRVDFTLKNLPVYITHKDFGLSLRHLRASRRMGQPLDTTQAAIAARLLADKIESSLFNGPGITVGTSTAYGYLNHPNINAITYSGTGELWDAPGKTGQEIMDDVMSMINALHADNFFGPYNLYVPGDYWVKLQNDFKVESDRTILERLLAIEGLKAIKPIDFLPADTTVMVQMTSDVVDMVIGEQVQTVQWESEGGFMAHFKVMAVMVPRVKADYDGRSGICKGTPT